MYCLPRSVMTGFSSTRSSARQFAVVGAPEHEQMRAGIVGDDLRGAGADEIRKPRIRNLDRRMQRVDRVENLLHGIGRRSRRQIRRHAKGEFGFADPHFIARHGSRAAIGNHRLGQDAPGHRAVDIDVLLPGLAGGGDLPAEQVAGRMLFDRRLDRVAFRAVARPLRQLRARRAWCRRANDRAGSVTRPRSDF